MLFVYTNAVLGHSEGAHLIGQSVEAIEGLIIQVQHIGEGHVDYIRQSNRNVLCIDSAGVGFGAHLVLFADVDKTGGD